MQDDYDERFGCYTFLARNVVRQLHRPSILAQSENDNAECFSPGDLVSVNCIRSSVHKENGTQYLRLSDGAGWIACEKGNMQEVPVAKGLWSFYVDNCPAGQALRRHPIDSTGMHILTDRGESILYHSMQKIFCDRKVHHPITDINYYRVQGTNGWVFDRRPNNNVSMLLPTSHVRFGTFCFQALSDILVRTTCTVVDREATLTPLMVEEGDLVAVDIIRKSLPDNNGGNNLINDSYTEDQNGPFLHLSDGSGWLYQKREGLTVMKEIPVRRGIWEIKVINHPDGVALRRHPGDCPDRVYKKKFPDNCLVQADAKVTSPLNGITYYRIRGSDGWLFDRKDDICKLQILTTSNPGIISVVEDEEKDGWSPDFVRGVAASVESVVEVAFHPSTDVLSFERDQYALQQQQQHQQHQHQQQETSSLHIDVYCKTRTVGVRVGEQPFKWYRKCTPRDLWMHLRQDVASIMMSSSTVSGKIGGDDDNHTNKISKAELEEKLRNDLLIRDNQMEVIATKRLQLMKKLKEFDDERARNSKEMLVLRNERKQEFENMVKRAESELMRLRASKQQQELQEQQEEQNKKEQPQLKDDEETERDVEEGGEEAHEDEEAEEDEEGDEGDEEGDEEAEEDEEEDAEQGEEEELYEEQNVHLITLLEDEENAPMAVEILSPHGRSVEVLNPRGRPSSPIIVLDRVLSSGSSRAGGERVVLSPGATSYVGGEEREINKTGSVNDIISDIKKLSSVVSGPDTPKTSETTRTFRVSHDSRSRVSGGKANSNNWDSRSRVSSSMRSRAGMSVASRFATRSVAGETFQSHRGDVRSRIHELLELQESISVESCSFDCDDHKGSFEHTDNERSEFESSYESEHSEEEEEEEDAATTHEKCRVCRKVFISPDELTEHYRNKHKLYCAECDKVYETHRDLEGHRFKNHRRK